MGAPKGNQYAKGNKGGTGNPGVYQDKFAVQAKRACEAGFTDWEIAELFGVSENTINEWKLRHKDFGLALKIGKGPADDRVERSLFHRATGYNYSAVKIFCNADGEETKVEYLAHVPPDPTSMIFWLKNRRRDAWRDKHETEVDGSITVKIKGGLPE